MVEMASNPMFQPTPRGESYSEAGWARAMTADSAGYARPSEGQPLVYEMNKPLPGLPAPVTAAADEHYSSYDAGDGELAVIQTATGGVYSVPTDACTYISK